MKFVAIDRVGCQDARIYWREDGGLEVFKPFDVFDREGAMRIKIVPTEDQ